MLVVSAIGLVSLAIVALFVGRIFSGQSGKGIPRGKNPAPFCPVAVGTVKNNFGVPRDGHTHYGDDILANFGAPVLATFDGTVSEVKTSGGWMVTLVAPDGSFTVG